MPASAKMTPKPKSATTSVETVRPSFHCSRRRTAGASRNDSRIATATGISTSWARYSTPAAIKSAMIEERRRRVPLEMYGDTPPPSGQLEEKQRARGDFVDVADVEAGAVGQVGHVGVGDQLQ